MSFQGCLLVIQLSVKLVRLGSRHYIGLFDVKQGGQVNAVQDPDEDDVLKIYIDFAPP